MALMAPFLLYNVMALYGSLCLLERTSSVRRLTHVCYLLHLCLRLLATCHKVFPTRVHLLSMIPIILLSLPALAMTFVNPRHRHRHHQGTTLDSDLGAIQYHPMTDCEVASLACDHSIHPRHNPGNLRWHRQSDDAAGPGSRRISVGKLVDRSLIAHPRLQMPMAALLVPSHP